MTTKIEQIMNELVVENRKAVNAGRYSKGEMIKEVIEKLKIINET
jgi:cell fate (sporulation/competence/biofilm development) regulator YmcA (YheA/YmcA/DUF963 family)